ncbi:MAG: hypothetical protein VB071_02370 [Lawsonibacter sp.]|nr:hypothetical protein [Lawsonibacter sp.]
MTFFNTGKSGRARLPQGLVFGDFHADKLSDTTLLLLGLFNQLIKACTLQNAHIGCEYESLYVFCPQIMLFNLDNEEKQVDIYTKFNIIATDTGRRVIVISFHERNKPIDYLFR